MARRITAKTTNCGSRHVQVAQAHLAGQSLIKRAHNMHIRASAKSMHSSQVPAIPPQKLKILVLGGTGFIGSTFIHAARKQGHTIVSLSRRGSRPDTFTDAPNTNSGIEWVSGDATKPEIIADVVRKHPDIDGCFHCIGLLLDDASGVSALNKFASGSGSVPSTGSTYDAITRVTSFNAIEAMEIIANNRKRAGDLRKVPFVFVSAAEAGWTFKAPVDFLERYLIAKRAVEQKLLSTPWLRASILRPSLVWSSERPQALLSVLPFYVASAIGVPFVDRPVKVETLVGAALTALEKESVSGVQRYMDMERLDAGRVN